MMRAIVIDGYGGPEVLRLAEVPPPVPAAGETLVRIRAVAVNPADPKWRAGLFAGFAPVPFPHILGYDIAGEVSGGTLRPLGQRVVGMLDPFVKGGYAEQVAVPDAQLAEIPPGLDDALAAAVPTAGLTGLQMVEALEVAAGQRILLTGAVGAVGRFAMHVARERGATVIAAVRAGQRDEAMALGAAAVVMLDSNETADRFDHIIDTVGGPSVARLCRHLRPGGRILTAATTPIDDASLPARPEIFAVRPDGTQLARLLAAVAAGAITVPIAHRLPLAEAAEAHRMIERGGIGGKVILQP